MTPLPPFDPTGDRRLAFTRLLAASLSAGPLPVCATFQWCSPWRIATFTPLRDGSLQVAVNIHFGRRPPLGEHELRFRAHFIAAYVHLLADAARYTPTTSFEGLAVLDALDCTVGRRPCRAHTPLVDRARPPALCPLDVRCGILALTRLLMEEPAVPEATVRPYLDTLLTYSGLPAIAYARRGTPHFAFVPALHRVARWERFCPTLCEDVALFRDSGLTSWSSATLLRLLDVAATTAHPFWMEAVVQLSAVSGQRELGQALLTRSVTREGLVAFRERCVLSLKSTGTHCAILLEDNRAALHTLLETADAWGDPAPGGCPTLHSLH